MSIQTYTDVPADFWANVSIDFVSNYEIMLGPSTGIFAPNSNITLGEFCAIAVRAAGISPVYGDSWATGQGTHWARKYIDYVRKARNIGLFINDDLTADLTDSVINTPITREFAFNIVWRLVASNRLMPRPYSTDSYNSGLRRFTDMGNVDDCTKEGVFNLIYYEIVSGFSASLLGPKADINRAQASKILSYSIATSQSVTDIIEAMKGGTVTFSAENGTYHDIPVTVSNLTDASSKRFRLAYNPLRLALEGFHVHSDGGTAKAVNSLSPNISITRFEPRAGLIEFEYTGNTSGPGFSGTIGVFRFRSEDRRFRAMPGDETSIGIMNI